MAKGSGYDVIVVGVGAMGSSACYHLAKRGARVLGLEQFDIPHARGSSHGQSRMIRMAYYEHPDYVPLLRQAYELWDEIEQVSGQKLLHVTGGLYMGPPDGEGVSGSLGSARQHGLEHELLDRAETARRFPQFTLPEDWSALYEPRAGFLLPERAVAAYAEAALRRGADLRGHEAVIAWRATDAGVGVRTPRGEYEADRLLFCGGSWSSKLMTDLGVPLVVTRQVLGWVWPRKPELFELGRLPVWAIERPNGLYYGFPMMPDSPGFKLADHGRGTETDPDRVAREVGSADEGVGGRRNVSPGARAVRAGGAGADARDAGVPVHPQPRLALHHRPASGSRARGARVRVQRARVQVCQRGGGGAGRAERRRTDADAGRVSRVESV